MVGETQKRGMKGSPEVQESWLKHDGLTTDPPFLTLILRSVLRVCCSWICMLVHNWAMVWCCCHWSVQRISFRSACGSSVSPNNTKRFNFLSVIESLSVPSCVVEGIDLGQRARTPRLHAMLHETYPPCRALHSWIAYNRM